MKQEISPRQKQILYYLAREQVDNSEPVSSIQIKEKYDLEFSPATIRHELFELCQMDYLEQPHISAGRILSDIGWQILISDFLENVLMEDILDPPDDLEELAKMLSNQTKALGIVYDWGNNVIYKKGLEYVLNDKTIDELKELALVAKTIDGLDEKLDSFKDVILDKQINVFFGKKNPLFKIDNLTLICTKSNDDQVLLGIITPKATNYEDHFKLFKSLINSLN